MSNLNARERDPQDENLGSFYMGRMRPSPQPRRILPRGALTVVILFSFAALIWYAYPQGQEKYSDIDIPTISADKTAYKFKPDDPGGMEVRHQDSTVFNPLENKPVDKVEHLRPNPEQPMNKADAVKAGAAPIDKTPHNLDLKTVSKGTEKLVSAEDKPAAAIVAKKEEPKTVVDNDIKTIKADPVKIEKVQEAAPKAATPKIEAAKPAVAKVEPVKPAAKPATKPVAAKPAETPKTTAATGDVYIQLGAYRDLAGAKQDWARMQKKFPETLGKLSMHTEHVTTAKGVLTRLQAGKVTEARGKSICASLKSGGQSACMIVK